MALSRLINDNTEVVRRTTDGDIDFIDEWAAACGIQKPNLAFRMLRDYLMPKKDFDALEARVEALRGVYQPLEDDNFTTLGKTNFDKVDVVDAMGEDANSFNKRHVRKFMKDGGKLLFLPGGKESFTPLITDQRENDNEPEKE